MAPQFRTKSRFLPYSQARIASYNAMPSKREHVPDSFYVLKGVCIKTRISLLATAIVLLAACNIAADDLDTIKFTNLESGEIALLVSETKNGSFENTVVKGSTGNQAITGKFTGQPGSIIAYTSDHAPTLETPVPWTNGVETVTMKLDNIHRIHLSVWVVNVGNSDFEQLRKNALLANDRTSLIWSNEHQGFEFSSFDIIDATKKTDSLGQSVPDKFHSQSFNCSRSSEIKDKVDGIGFTPGAINVYYVETVQVEGDELNTGGEYCASENLVVLGAGSFDDLLVHELGHAFSLEHIDHLAPSHFDKTNVMHPESKIRNFLTEGQTFRAIANAGSAINILYKTRTDTSPKVRCGTSDRITAHDCPAIQKRIWKDDGEDGKIWEPDDYIP